MAVTEWTPATIRHPINVNSRDFTLHHYETYEWLRKEAPVYRARFSVVGTYLLSRYEDCRSFYSDERLLRNRVTATGGGRMPFPLPKSVSLYWQNMITEDEPDHRRLRNLVSSAFAASALAGLEGRVERLTHELLDGMEKRGTVDLIREYAYPIPVRVMCELVGISDDDVPELEKRLQLLTHGFSAWNFAKSVIWELPRVAKFARYLIARKRAEPGDDLLTSLVQARDDADEGEQLSEDELISTVILLIFAGHDTTMHVIANGVLALLQHPDQMDRLRAEPALVESAVEEILRYVGPIQATKPAYAVEPITMHGVTIPRGSAVMPLIGSANRDPTVFEEPDVFDIGRSPNRHLALGHGVHYCLGAALARLEIRIALRSLIERIPNLRLAVNPGDLVLQNMPMWHRYEQIPIRMD